MNTSPDGFQRHMSRFDSFVERLDIEDVRQVVLQANAFRKTGLMDSDLIERLSGEWAAEVLGDAGAADTGTFEGLEAACCRRLAFSTLLEPGAMRKNVEARPIGSREGRKMDIAEMYAGQIFPNLQGAKS